MSYSINKLGADCDSISAALSDWECTQLAASNARLYAILADCYALYKLVNANEDNRKAVTQLAEDRGIAVGKSTHTAIKLIKIIFGPEPRWRASAYAQVLRVAEGQGVAFADFATWLDAAGGVEAVRRAGPTSSRDPNKAANAYEAGVAKIQNIGPIGTLAPHQRIAERNAYIMLLGYAEADGSVTIFNVVGKPDSDQINTHIRSIGNSKSIVPHISPEKVAVAKAQKSALQACIDAGRLSTANSHVAN
ncbi:hypothetical protein [Magnetospirillum molischianum]|uniref:Uncharacterized protein n=1 Tax=Magnetospirillum molischianum DSM 120 TaxID=1150626 RepID=H8FWV5_MAGML|nr:hypothetical protein [Magnetospirillum molischianum]CCG42843.1 conserved hypothetical protein [Magnetospirillum molischianum DSM 120]